MGLDSSLNIFLYLIVASYNALYLLGNQLFVKRSQHIRIEKSALKVPPSDFIQNMYQAPYKWIKVDKSLAQTIERARARD